MNTTKQLTTVLIVIAGSLHFGPLCYSQGNSGNNGNGNSGQGMTHWKISGNQAGGNDFIGTTNQQDLIFKTNGSEALKIDQQQDAVFNGDLKLEKFNDPTLNTGEKRWLFMENNGLLKSAKTAGFMEDFYERDCVQSSLLVFSTWASVVDANSPHGILYTGDFCPARVGIGTKTPENHLDVKGKMCVGGTFGGSEAAPTNGLLVEGKVGIGTTNPNGMLHVNNPMEGANGVIRATAWNMARTKQSDVAMIAVVSNNTQEAQIQYLGKMLFVDQEPGIKTPRMIIHDGGKVEIREADNNQEELIVRGTIGACEIIVEEDAWCDFVFEPGYNRLSPLEKAKFYTNNKHLIGLPSEAEILDNGLNVGEVMKGFVRNLEENSLDLVDLFVEVEKLKVQMEALKTENCLLKEEIKHCK